MDVDREVDREMETVDSKRAALRHRPMERRPFVHSDGGEPQLAIKQANPRELPLTIPRPSRREGLSETTRGKRARPRRSSGPTDERWGYEGSSSTPRR